MTAQPRAQAGAKEQADDGFADVHRALVSDGSIQFELPRLEVQASAQPRTKSDPGDIYISSGGIPGASALAWVMLAALALILLHAVASRMDLNLRFGRAKAGGEGEDDSWRPEAAPARRLLGEADELAAQGQYSEAAHLLLHRSIADIEERRPQTVRPAFTSRDIAGLGAIPPTPRAAFARIAMAVERSLFARRPLAAEDWRDCRSAYEAFAFTEGWRA